MLVAVNVHQCTLVSVCLELIPKIVLVFGPKWVSYDRSRRMQHAKMRKISARVFFVKIPKSQDSMIYTIFSFFRIHIPNMDSFANVSVTRPGRPSARPPWITSYQTDSYSSISQFKTESNWFGFQYFSVHKLSTCFVFQDFHNSN